MPRIFSRTVFVRSLIALILFSCHLGTVSANEPVSEPKKPSFKQPAWGEIIKGSVPGGFFFRSKEKLTAKSRLIVPEGFPQIVRVGRLKSVKSKIDEKENDCGRVEFQLVNGSKKIRQAVVVPSKSDVGDKLLYVFTANKTEQHSSGRIVFTANDAVVKGKNAKLESNPGNYRIGFWRNIDTSVVWNYKATRWGMYNVHLTYATSHPDGTEIEIEIGGSKVKTVLKKTGSFYHYTTVDCGKLYMAKAGKQTLTVRCLKKTGRSIINLKSVILTPACEGTHPAQKAAGQPIVLHGRDATVHGTCLRYEPAKKKQTLGFWRYKTDKATWVYKVLQAGEYDVEVLQGCGKGQGGSQMGIYVNSGDGIGMTSKSLKFTVEDTGHFQNFKAKIIGRVKLSEKGHSFIFAQPLSIAKNSCCDIRQIRLIPVKK